MDRQRAAWSRLTRKQRVVVFAGTGLALVGLVLTVTVDVALGAAVISVASLVVIFTSVFAPPD
ncbi:hypothetical protein O7598_06635 [Micromonospora sp. WMMC241]|uniref:hypothetical protein n=1 Tax=Micromonospora sp. WMMC241 TaxID=3015159 RepID=UPI0022B6D8AC|nr:hypothetical protein [Micromonospora sp. WMMC241]MCZ7436061.1 hypothetical protein [Micromonospora sp. WMMC241]